jgi:hypothetical protein
MESPRDASWLPDNTANDNRYDGLIVINAGGYTLVSDSVGNGNGNGAFGFDTNRCDGVTFANYAAARNAYGGFFNILSTNTTYAGNTAHEKRRRSGGPARPG